MVPRFRSTHLYNRFLGLVLAVRSLSRTPYAGRPGGNCSRIRGGRWHIGATALPAPSKKGGNWRGEVGGGRIHPLARPRPTVLSSGRWMAVHGRSHDKGTGQGRETDIFFEGAPGGGAFPSFALTEKRTALQPPTEKGVSKPSSKIPVLNPGKPRCVVD